LEGRDSGTPLHEGGPAAALNLPGELEAALERLPTGRRKTEPTDEQLRLLRKYWKSGRNQREVARLIGLGPWLARRIYDEMEAKGWT
jgi:hypothetical protein